MKVEAKITRTWRDRMFLILIFTVGSAAWFYYDGFVAWPKKIEAANAYKELKEKAGGEINATEWASIAERNGWDTSDPGEPKTEEDLATQKYIGTFFVVVSVLYLIWFVRQCKRVIHADDESFADPSGALVRYDRVVAVDKRKWDNKGIAYAIYEDEKGIMRKAIIDDYKYGGSEVILNECEARLAAKEVSTKEESV